MRHRFALVAVFLLFLAAAPITLARAGVFAQAQPVGVLNMPSPGGTIDLYPGWNNIALTFPDGTPITAVAAAISPSGILRVIWSYDAAVQAWFGFAPGAPPAAIDLNSVDFLQTVFIRVFQNVCGPNPDPANPAFMLVTQPVPEATVSGSVHVAGMAAVFEAHVDLTLYDAMGGVIVDTFTMTAEGQTLSPFATDIPFNVSSPTLACLWVYAESARDGSPTQVVQIPLLLLP